MGISVEKLQKEIKVKEEQLSSLKDMMSRTTCYLEQTLEELKRKSKELSQSVSYAKTIQVNLLPKLGIFKQVFKESVYMVKQRDTIGGDMIFAKRIGDYLCFGLMDCTGHGIPGALISMMGYSFLMDEVDKKNINNPASILTSLNNNFKDFFTKGDEHSISYNGMDGILCSYQISSKKLKYSSAGRPLWYTSYNKWVRERPITSSIGDFTKNDFSNKELLLNEGDELFLFSDGVADQFGGTKNKKFMSRRILQQLDKASEVSLKSRVNSLKNELKDWQGQEEQTDDISFLALKL